MNASAEDASPLVQFLAGRAPDASGRYLDDILAMDDAALEKLHDYIQWLFPLMTASAAVPGSPVLRREEISAIRTSPSIQDNLARAVERMELFYGRTSRWLVAHDHNHLRITRIIRSTQLLQGPDEARDFYDAIIHLVSKAGRPVAPGNMKFWRDAAGL